MVEKMEQESRVEGPIENRSCTDIICLLLFLVFFLVFIVVGVYAFFVGRPETLLYPTDSSGRFCGKPGDPYTEGKPYLYFFDLVSCFKKLPTSTSSINPFACNTPQVCVAKCPESDYLYGMANGLNGSVSKPLICIPGHAPSDQLFSSTSDVLRFEQLKEFISNQSCAWYYLNSKPVLNRCVPAFVHDAVTGIIGSLNVTNVPDDLKNETADSASPIVDINAKDVNEALGLMDKWLKVVNFAQKALQDIHSSWYVLLALLFITMFWGLIWIVLMRFISGIMVWLSIFLFVAIFIVSTVYCFMRYLHMKNIEENAGPKEYVFTTEFSYYLEIANTWLGFGIASAVVLVILLLIVVFLRSRIMIAVEMINQASKAIGHMMTVLLWPLFPFLAKVAIIAFFLAAVVNIASIERVNALYPNGTSVVQDQVSKLADKFAECSKPNKSQELEITCRFLKFQPGEYTIYLHIYMLFMFFWTMNFVVALSEMTLAGAFASYVSRLEISQNLPDDIPAMPILASFWRCFRYHLGSIAFGALIVSIIQMIRVGLEYLDSKLKGSENIVARFFVKCLACCFWCLEKIIRFINRNAYIMIAIHGKNFCVSAKDATLLIIRNAVRAFVVDKVTDYLLFIAKLVIVGGVTTLSYFYFNGTIASHVLLLRNFQPELNYFVVPIVIVAVGAYFVASLFLSVYAMGVDTIFLCFLQDLEMNDGSASKPYYMSKELMKILDKKNQPPEGEKTKSGCC